MGTLSSRPPPGSIVKEGQTFFTVHTIRVMLAVTNKLAVLVAHTFAGVAVALAPVKQEVFWMIQVNDTQRS